MEVGGIGDGRDAVGGRGNGGDGGDGGSFRGGFNVFASGVDVGGIGGGGGVGGGGRVGVRGSGVVGSGGDGGIGFGVSGGSGSGGVGDDDIGDGDIISGPNVIHPALVGKHHTFIMPPNARWNAQWGYKGEKKKLTNVLKYLKTKIIVPVANNENGINLTLEDRFKNSVFGQFVTAEANWKFSGLIWHYMYERMIYPDRPDEFQFQFGNAIHTYGKREFAMMSGLRFGSYDGPIGNTTRLIGPGRLFEENELITVMSLERKLVNPDFLDPEILYQLCLVYVVYGYILGYEENTRLPGDIFHIVEDLDRVDEFPWGEYLWNKTYSLMCKHINTNKKYTIRSSARRPQLEGWYPGFQYWAYETFHRLHFNDLGKPFVNLVDPTVLPRMLKWKFADTIPRALTLESLNLEEQVITLKVQGDEIQFLRGLDFPDEAQVRGERPHPTHSCYIEVPPNYNVEPPCPRRNRVIDEEGPSQERRGEEHVDAPSSIRGHGARVDQHLGGARVEQHPGDGDDLHPGDIDDLHPGFVHINNITPLLRDVFQSACSSFTNEIQNVRDEVARLNNIVEQQNTVIQQHNDFIRFLADRMNITIRTSLQLPTQPTGSPPPPFSVGHHTPASTPQPCSLP